MKPKRLKTILAVIPMLMILYLSNSFSKVIGITVSSNVFTPSTVSAAVGDTIRWTWISGFHSTTCDGSAFTSRPAGAASWDQIMFSSTPIFQYVITVAGTYNYKCSFHATLGMVGVINASAPALLLNLTVLIEGFWNGTSMVNDTVKAYLRNPSSPYAFRDSAKVNLNSLGNGSLSFSNVGSGSYYIVVIHRNSIETWTKLPQSFTVGVVKNYDFTTAATQAFGDNMILKSGEFCIYSGDVNQDGVIDGSDLSIIDNDAAAFLSGYVPSDVDGNNFVDGTDALITGNNSDNFISKMVPSLLR